MSNKLQGPESFEHFKRIVPQNPVPWEGTVVLYSPWCNTFFNVAFGTGDNLSDEDIDDGFDDYIMVDQYRLEDDGNMAEVILKIKNTGCIDECSRGLREIDGGQWLLKRREWQDGDIRRFLMEAMSFAGYNAMHRHKDMRYKDVVYLGADYDVWHKDDPVARRKGASHEVVD